MKNYKIILFIFYLLLTFNFAQKAELITQQVNVENAIRGKVENTLNKFMNDAQYLVIVNARLEFKPLSMGSANETNVYEQTTSPYTLIPGLDMPSIPTQQNIYQPSQNGSFQYSTEKYFLYGLDITIYIDEEISTGSLQQNIKSLITQNIPEIADCQDCVKMKTINFLPQNGQDSRYDELTAQIELLEQDRIDAENTLQNWRFEQLEDQLAESKDARTQWEEQARNRDNQRRIEDSTRLSNLHLIEKKYREKQDSLYVLTSIKLDEALRGRIQSEETTKKELLGLIKMQIQGEEINGLSDNTRSDLYTKKPSLPSNSISGQIWLMIIAVLLLLAILVIMTKNKKTVYLKPKNILNEESPSEQNAPFPDSQVNQNQEVKRSELQSLRQTAVSQSVSEKEGASQIVQDWLNDGTADTNDDNQNEDSDNNETKG